MSALSQKTLGLLVHQIECTAFSIANAAAAMGWRVVVFAAPELNERPANAVYREHLLALSGVRVEMGFQPIDLNMLYIEVTRFTPRDRAHFYAKRARRIGMISHSIRPTVLRTVLAQMKDLRGMDRLLLRARRFLYVDGFLRTDLYRLFGPRAHLGIDVHSAFLLQAELGRKMFAFEWEPQQQRRYLLNFMGCGQPEPREQILREVESALQQRGTSLARTPEAAGNVLWFVGAGVSRERFCELLAECDYTLCPRGYGRATHRVVEALVRGSVPILQADELQLYDLDLESGRNCIAVPPGRWGETVTAALNANESSISQMRANILAMRENYLTIDASNRRLCRRLAIEI